MDLNLFLTISKCQNHEHVHTFMSLNKKIRQFVIVNFVQIINWLLETNGSNKLPRWCFMKMNMETPYPSLAEQVQDWKVSRMLRIPSCLNIKGGVLAGGSVAQAVFRGCDKYWEPGSNDYDIFVPCGEPETKRIKVEFNSVTLDLVFKTNDISDFDLSVCQIGISLDTNEVYATPLFLYSVKRNVMVCRVSNFGVGYLQEYREPVTNTFDDHIRRGHDAYFCYCHLCNCDLLMENDGEYGDFVQNWWDRVKKYHSRFPSYKLHFVKYD